MERYKEELLPWVLNQTGIYKIKNIFTGNFYIGSTAQSFRKRFERHLATLRKGTHHNQYLQRSFQKYGEESFVLYPIEFVPPEECVSREQDWMDALKPAYNACPNAGSTFGVKLSVGTRAKMSEAGKGRTCSADTRRKISEAHKGSKYFLGRTHSVETRVKMSAARKGRTTTAETRRKISESKKGNKNCLGRVLTAEHRQKIGTASKIRNKGEKNPRFDHKVYTFHHKAHGIEKCTQYALCGKYMLRQNNLSSVIHGRYKSCEGWRMAANV